MAMRTHSVPRKLTLQQPLLFARGLGAEAKGAAGWLQCLTRVSAGPRRVLEQLQSWQALASCSAGFRGGRDDSILSFILEEGF